MDKADFGAEPPVLQHPFMKVARLGIERHCGRKEHDLEAAFGKLRDGKKGTFLIAGVEQSQPERTFSLFDAASAAGMKA